MQHPNEQNIMCTTPACFIFVQEQKKSKSAGLDFNKINKEFFSWYFRDCNIDQNLIY